MNKKKFFPDNNIQIIYKLNYIIYNGLGDD